jgi:SAM-dependent methyltransferase
MALAKQVGRLRANGLPAEAIGAARYNETCACPLCGAFETRAGFRDAGSSLRVCEVCELFFVDPYPCSSYQHTRVLSGRFYEIDILDCARRYQGEKLYYDRHFALIAEECRDATTLLDVGCGTGHLLERLGSFPKLHRTGIELNAQAAQFARRVSGCEILELPFESFRGEHRFDAVTLINVFSHITSFDALFRSARAALRPGGKLILRTSEMSANANRWNQMHWGIPDDLHFLGLRTLEFLCAKYGFVVARHLMTPFEEELFLPSRWQQMGRNRLLNLMKIAAVQTPLALRAMKAVYTRLLGQRLFVSFIVLMPLGDE